MIFRRSSTTTKLIIFSTRILQRDLSSTPVSIPKKTYELVIIGGGAGGLAVASRFTRYFRALKKPPNSIAVVEPKDVHYYQPLWTLVGAGLKNLYSSSRPMNQVMPSGVDWIQEQCSRIDPGENRIQLTGSSGSIEYKYLVVATGIQIDWNKIQGLEEALKNPSLENGVCSNYSSETVLRTWNILQRFKGGRAVFTFPNTAIKCAGAPQKIMYLTDAYLRKNGIREKTTISYHTPLASIFSSPHYAKALMELCKQRDLNVNLKNNLIRIDPNKKRCYFQNMDKPDDPLQEIEYDMLHVAPPMSAPGLLSPLATDKSNGFVAVNPETLQHVEYPNVFSLGDCSSCPTSKTAAAVAGQNYLLSMNLLQLIQHNDGRQNPILADKLEYQSPKIDFKHLYDGYTSCPIVTGFDQCIMAEFNYKLEPVETFPFDQRKQRRMMYLIKKDILPWVYWNGLLKGYWSGPSIYRKLLHFGFK